ncbi:MAG: NIL domain-containing protein [Nitrospirota bacterium]
MPIKRLLLIFPEELINEPVIFTMAKLFDVMPNIRQANVTEYSGEMLLELEGSEQRLDQSIAYLKSRGITVSSIEHA